MVISLFSRFGSAKVSFDCSPWKYFCKIHINWYPGKKSEILLVCFCLNYQFRIIALGFAVEIHRFGFETIFLHYFLRHTIILDFKEENKIVQKLCTILVRSLQRITLTFFLPEILDFLHVCVQLASSVTKIFRSFESETCFNFAKKVVLWHKMSEKTDCRWKLYYRLLHKAKRSIF